MAYRLQVLSCSFLGFIVILFRPRIFNKHCVRGTVQMFWLTTNLPFKLFSWLFLWFINPG